MKAIILAAGKGSRLKNFTENKPKGLIEVKNKPILAYQLEALKANGIEDILIVIGYKGFMIKDFISKHPIFKDLNVTYIENDEYSCTNTSYSWFLTRNSILNEESILHLHSDLIFFEDLIRKIINSKHENAIYIDKNIQLNESMEQVILDRATGKLIHMDKANVPGAQGKAVGIAKFSKKAISSLSDKIHSYIDIGDKNQAFYGIIRKLIHELDFYGLDLGDSFFREINTVEDYRIAKKDYLDEIQIPSKTSIIMLYGAPATGKTTISRKIRDYFEKEINVEIISTFRIREELGLTDLYSSEQREKVYDALTEILEAKLERKILNCIILDGNFNKRERREKIYEIVKKHNCDLYIIKCVVDNIDEIQRRLDERKKYPGVLEHKAATLDLHKMIQKTTDSVDKDNFPNDEPIIIVHDTQTKNISIRPQKFIAKGILEALQK